MEEGGVDHEPSRASGKDESADWQAGRDWSILGGPARHHASAEATRVAPCDEGGHGTNVAIHADDTVHLAGQAEAVGLAGLRLQFRDDVIRCGHETFWILRVYPRRQIGDVGFVRVRDGGGDFPAVVHGHSRDGRRAYVDSKRHVSLKAECPRGGVPWFRGR